MRLTARSNQRTNCSLFYRRKVMPTSDSVLAVDGSVFGGPVIELNYKRWIRDKRQIFQVGTLNLTRAFSDLKKIIFLALCKS